MPASRWADLGLRSASGLAMAALAAVAVTLGGVWFAALAWLVSALMVWELAQMMGLRAAAPTIAASAAAFMAVALWQANGWWLVPALMPLTAGALGVRRDPLLLPIYGGAIMAVGYMLVNFFHNFGTLWLIWLVAVVVVTDVAGYFAGRLIGGPKVLPRISPKKTWSGTIAGWLGAAAVAWAFVRGSQAGPALILVSVAVSMAAQAGDIGESLIKRRMGEKDSSNLIPGHGGLLDRFDGLIGAVAMMVVITQVVMVPMVQP